MAHRDGEERAGLEQRVEVLERRLRFHRRAGLVAGWLAAGALALGAAAPGARVVEAEKFVLRDAAGRERGVWEMGPEGTGLAMRDEQGKLGVGLGVYQSGRGLVLSDGQDVRRASVFVQRGGAPSVLLSDAKGATRAGIGLSPQGIPAIFLYDEKGKERMGLSALPQGATIQLKDSSGKSRALLLAVDPEGPGLLILNENEQPIWRAPIPLQ